MKRYIGLAIYALMGCVALFNLFLLVVYPELAHTRAFLNTFMLGYVLGAVAEWCTR